MTLSPEQQRAVEREGQDVCCVAGPGSGKTRVLVERFAWLIGKGVDPETILAITYTEKAARELKSRLVKRYQQDIEMRQKIERAPVSTIHGLCNSILRENAIAAGLDPEFTVLDELQADVELASATAAVLDRVATEQPESFAQLIDAWASERPASDLAGLYKRLRRYGGAAAALASEPDLGALLPAMAADIARLLAESAAALAFPATDAQRRRLDLVNGFVQTRDTMAGDEWLDVLAAFKLPGGKKMPGQDELKAARDMAVEAAPLALWIRHGEDRGALRRLLTGIEEEFRRRKRLLSGLDFADLEEYALSLLQSHTALRQELQGRFKAILMDEVQDTNPIQWSIVGLLRTPGRFFAVGDANQAIYAFRDADPALFAAYEQEVAAAGGEIDRLESNYRSLPELLAPIERLAHSGATPGIAPHRLIPAEGAEAGLAGPRIEIQRIDGENESPEAEALWLAARLAELKTQLDVPWSECAVLARTSSSFDQIEAAFEQFGIPCVIARGRNFFDEPEIIDSINWLRVMDSPADHAAVFGLLRSPFLGLADEEIFLSKQNGAFPPPEAGEAIEAMRQLRDQTAAPLLLARFAGETGYYNRLDSRGRANFEKFLDMLQGLESSHPGDWAYWIESIDSLASTREPNAPQTDSADAVQILSIHKSKGLEFEIVAIAAMDRGTGNDSGSLNYSPEFGLGARWRDASGLDGQADFAYARTPRQSKQDSDAEADRLLYVAMTRAKSHLLLSWRDKSRSRCPWPAQIEQAWEIEWPDTPDAAAESNGVRVVVRSGLPDIVRIESGQSRTEVEWRDPMPEDRWVPPEITATSLARFDSCPRRYWLGSEIRWPAQPAPAGAASGELAGGNEDAVESGGMRLGSEVHALLAGESVPNPSAEALRLAAVFRDSDLGARAKAARRVEREYNFLAGIDGMLVRGVIDLWFEDSSGVTIVDYKTGHAGPDLMSEYMLQLQIYSLALRAIAGGAPVRACLFLLESGREIEVGTDEDAERRVMSAIAQFRNAASNGGYPMKPGTACRYCPYWKSVCPGADEA
ncbi:MAG: UvrD-helicase domain-containing protein [Bryobacteraceae bacterium]|nr:UvrD-helicase domain-containing protein [Bryobacteraceae bacterium]